MSDNGFSQTTSGNFRNKYLETIIASEPFWKTAERLGYENGYKEGYAKGFKDGVLSR